MLFRSRLYPEPHRRQSGKSTSRGVLRNGPTLRLSDAPPMVLGLESRRDRRVHWSRLVGPAPACDRRTRRERLAHAKCLRICNPCRHVQNQISRVTQRADSTRTVPARNPRNRHARRLAPEWLNSDSEPMYIGISHYPWLPAFCSLSLKLEIYDVLASFHFGLARARRDPGKNGERSTNQVLVPKSKLELLHCPPVPVLALRLAPRQSQSNPVSSPLTE